MATATLTISGTKTGLPSGNVTIGPAPIVNTYTTGADDVLAAVLGDNTVLVPSASAIGCLIIPAMSGISTLTLKGAAGDRGVPLHPANPSLISFPAGTSGFILNVAPANATLELVFF